jgi:hypothetical protein
MTQTAPNESQRLAQFIAEARSAKAKKTDDLDRFRAIILRERKAGAPVRAIVEGLAKIGIAVSGETLRTWLVAQGVPKPQAIIVRRVPAPTPVAAKSQTAQATAAVAPSPARNPGPRVARDDI